MSIIRQIGIVVANIGIFFGDADAFWDARARVLVSFVVFFEGVGVGEWFVVEHFVFGDDVFPFVEEKVEVLVVFSWVEEM